MQVVTIVGVCKQCVEAFEHGHQSQAVVLAHPMAVEQHAYRAVKLHWNLALLVASGSAHKHLFVGDTTLADAVQRCNEHGAKCQIATVRIRTGRRRAQRVDQLLTATDDTMNQTVESYLVQHFYG